MSKLTDVEHRGRAVGSALRLATALAMMGFGRAQAATVPAGDAPPTAAAAEAAPAAAAVEAGGAAVPVPRDTARRRMKGSPLDRRVALLAKELGLSGAQQAKVRKVLEGQREQVARVWNDPSIPAARRVSATQAIGDRTADKIRALLSDEQRQKYVKPRQRGAAVGATGGSAETWMKADRRK